MKVFKHLRSDWFRYGFETLAVVVGILVAFALENWRDTQKVKVEEHEILVDLLHDLRDAKQQSAISIHEEVKSKEYSILALNHISNKDTLPLDFYTDSILYEVIWFVEMDVPVINSYSDIKNTGKTSLITNEQIRMDEIAVNDLNFVRLISWFIPEIKVDNEPENNYQSFLENQRIRNLIAVKLALTTDVIKYREELEAEIISLISLLETEIENF